MKTICTECGKSSYKSHSELMEEGWAGSAGMIDGKRFKIVFCNDCYSPEKFAEHLVIIRKGGK